MYDYIKIGAWRSDSVPDLHVMDWQRPLLAKAERQVTDLPGRLTALVEKDRWHKPEPITVNLVMLGTSRAEIRQKLEPILPILWAANDLSLSDTPQKHYRGHTVQVEPVEDLEEWMRLRLHFQANPPCLLRTMGENSGWIPSPQTPIAEQITELNATHNLRIDQPKQLLLGGALTAYKPEVHMLLIGSWDRLVIGGNTGLTIPGLGLTSAVYLDASGMQVYDKVDGKRRPVPDCSGNFDQIIHNQTLEFSGINLNLTAHILVIERS